MCVFCSFLAPERIAFSEKRVRLAPESNDLKKLSAGDPCEVNSIDTSIEEICSLLFVFRCSRELKKMGHWVGGQPLRKCSKANFSLSIIKLALMLMNIRRLCLVIKSVVPIQSKITEELLVDLIVNEKFPFSPPITYATFKRLELPVERDLQEL